MNKLLLLSLLPSLTASAAISLDFAALPRTAIQFNGAASSFQLNPLAGPQFRVVNDTGGSGSAIGLNGWVTGGPWSYGAITTSGTTQSATVSAGGVLHISDGSSDLTGNVNWIEIATMQSIGGVNASLLVNVTGLSYGGANADLLTLASSPSGSMNLSFQFSPSLSLNALTSGTLPFRTSYSGSISGEPVPEVGTLLAAALLLLPLGLSLRRR